MAAAFGTEKAGSNRKDDVRTQFATREGVYKLMGLSEYSRPSRFPPNSPSNILVRLSFAYVLDSHNNRVNDVISFNIGKELYAYAYNGIRKAADLTQPLEKKTYKGPAPTCHAFNCFSSKPDNLTLLVGFTHGQIQLTEVILKESVKLFNDERLIDTSKVTCVQWVPHLPNQFLASHSSGYLYVYDDQLMCGNQAPTYQVLLEGPGFVIQSYSAKNMRNPLYRWSFDGGGAIHEFAFSPCARFLAIVFASGQLRIFNYHRMELVGVMRSYFGGLRCVAWSPDGRYVATGGEDDLITVWSFREQRIVCRGVGHHAWINSIAFDPYMTTFPNNSIERFENGDGLLQSTLSGTRSSHSTPVSYRLGSVGDDTFFCLWELVGDVLIPQGSATTTDDINLTMPHEDSHKSFGKFLNRSQSLGIPANRSLPSELSGNFSALDINEQQLKDISKRTASLDKSDEMKLLMCGSKSLTCDDSLTYKLGSPSYPRLIEVPLLEPMVRKKIAKDRLSAVVFREDCIVTACQDGVVSTWSRPGLAPLTSGYL